MQVVVEDDTDGEALVTFNSVKLHSVLFSYIHFYSFIFNYVQLHLVQFSYIQFYSVTLSSIKLHVVPFSSI